EAVDAIEMDKTQIQQAMKSGRTMDAMKILLFVRENNLHDPIADGLASILSNDRSYFEKLVSSLYPLLEKLTTGKTAQILSPQYDDPTDPRPIFDWMSVIDRGAVVYVGLDSLSDYEVAGAVGNAMFADLTSIAGQTYKFEQGYGLSTAIPKRKLSIHADEFNELIGDEFIPLLNKAGGAGFQVAVYTQTWADVEARIGNKAKASQIGGNLNTLIMLRVKNKETAEILTDQLPDVQLVTSIQASAATDSSDDREVLSFTTRNEDRISTQEAPMLSPADLVQLPKGQAFALIEGGQLYKIR
ncbi:MAG: TraM recognition domain-containing protein, partial [Gammaproteobacteria bacterium]